MSRPVPFEINDDGELTVTVDGEVFILDPKTKNGTAIASQ